MMRKDLAGRNVALVVLAFFLGFGVGSYFYVQQQEMSNLQQQTDQLLDAKVRVELLKDRIALRNAIAGILIQGSGGLFFFVTAYFSWQNLKATQRNVLIAEENLKTTQHNGLVAEEKQVTERFTQAINQLGSKEITVRVGGIYALERISKDSEKDYWTIMEVLTSFIREPVQSNVGQSEEQQLTEPLPKITKDVQAALTVLVNPESRQDLGNKKLNLVGANLIGANLIKADLVGANLIGVDLRRANLKEADLSGANLSGANLYGANLDEAYLIGAHVVGANLHGANLGEADLRESNLYGANLIWADLRGADLREARLRGANLSEADLSGAKLIPEQVEVAENWKKANYNNDFRQKLGLPLE